MKAKFRFNLEDRDHDIEVHEDGHVTIVSARDVELTFESVEALAQEFAASRNVPANILKNFELSQHGSVYVFAQRSGTAGSDDYEEDYYGEEEEDEELVETEEDEEDEEEDEEIIDPIYDKVKGAFDVSVNVVSVVDDLRESFENPDNAVLFTKEGSDIIRKRVEKRIAVAELTGGHVDVFKFVAGETPSFEVTDDIDAFVLPVADIVIVVDEADVPALREFVCGPAENTETAVTESPLFSRMFR